MSGYRNRSTSSRYAPAGNVHDSQELPNLLRAGETRLYGDSAYQGKNQRAQLKALALKAKNFTNKRAHEKPCITVLRLATRNFPPLLPEPALRLPHGTAPSKSDRTSVKFQRRGNDS